MGFSNLCCDLAGFYNDQKANEKQVTRWHISTDGSWSHTMISSKKSCKIDNVKKGIKGMNSILLR